MTELAKAYEPKEVEGKWYAFWLKNNFFHAPDKTKAKPYTIVIPPPNVTGALHMGHALNNTLQDILIRWKRMLGFSALWMPGTDHAGIATQNVVERELKEKEGKTRHDLGREKLIDRIWQWKEQYGNRILDQLKALGASCDWDRTRFTLDEGLSAAVRECFVTLYERGLIYRGKYIVNWCPRCQTALSDDEVEYQEQKGHLWHLRYPLSLTLSQRERKNILSPSPLVGEGWGEGAAFVVVATTRPETMLGDVAVAVHPKDKRYTALIGKKIMLPEVGREIPVIADTFVDPKFGSGCVKVTPAHDPNDFQMGLRHKLPQINVMNGDGTMSKEAPAKYQGLTREICRQKIVKAFTTQGLLEKVEEHVHSVGHCYRCETVVEPWASDQWFVKMKPLAEKAIKATRKKKVQFFPERWESFYLQWLENVRDWCISRQIWWGHRIPVFYCCKKQENFVVAKEKPKKCPFCGDCEMEQDPDVLDTWFSSALWSFSTLGWPEKTEALKTYYPTSTLVTDRGIIFFWVARMVMMGLEFMKEIPFGHVYINGTILDKFGRKMSKSHPETCIDPMDVIAKYGADAMRYSLVLLATEGQDLKLSEERFEMGKHFCNKLWNASRFAMMNLKGFTVNGQRSTVNDLTLADKWIWNRLQITIAEVKQALENYQFHHAGQALYRFVWNEFCDWYLELIKPFVMENQATQWNLHRTLETILRLAHPFMPFITEELWQALNPPSPPATLLAGKQPSPSRGEGEVSIMVAPYPKPEKKIPFAEALSPMVLIQEIITSLRNLRSEHQVKPQQKIQVHLYVADKKMRALVEQNRIYLVRLAQVSTIQFLEKRAVPPRSVSVVVPGAEIFVPFAELFDAEQEQKRLRKEMEKVELEIGSVKQKMANKNFVERAPKEVVETERNKLETAKTKLEKLQNALAQLT